ncbi:MAG: hypothetical protein ACTSP3_07485 [Candidatus Heimdallarchaeaceae archaeon]
MKIEINIKKGPFQITITDELSDKKITEFIKEMFEFIESQEEFISKPLTIQENFDKEKLSRKPIKAPKTKAYGIEEHSEKFPKELEIIIKKTNIKAEELLGIFDIDDFEYKVYPLQSSLDIGKNRAEQQRISVLIFLYLNYIVNGLNILSSKVLSELLTKSGIDSTKLSDAFRYEQSLVKIEKRSYKITKKGIVEAPKVIKKLLESRT